jgi:hypothetical protein
MQSMVSGERVRRCSIVIVKCILPVPSDSSIAFMEIASGLILCRYERLEESPLKVVNIFGKGSFLDVRYSLRFLLAVQTAEFINLVKQIHERWSFHGVERIHIININRDADTSRFGVNDKRAFEQVILVFGDVHVKARVAVRKDDLVDAGTERLQCFVGRSRLRLRQHFESLHHRRFQLLPFISWGAFRRTGLEFLQAGALPLLRQLLPHFLVRNQRQQLFPVFRFAEDPLPFFADNFRLKKRFQQGFGTLQRRVQRLFQLALLRRVISPGHRGKVLHDRTSGGVTELACSGIADPTVNPTATGENPDGVFEAEVFLDGFVKDLRGHVHEFPALFGDLGAFCSGANVIVVCEVNIEHKLTFHRLEVLDGQMILRRGIVDSSDVNLRGAGRK